jgi:hypothetical protein
MPATRDFIEVMAKHLPPSASELHLLDVGGVAGTVLHALRQDLQIDTVSMDVSAWDYDPNSVDAVVAYDVLLDDNFLETVLNVMRPGGRLVVVHPVGDVDVAYVETLEQAGYTRILVEAALDETGVLIRGEKEHTTSDTFERVQQVAQQDADTLDLDTYRGRYVHLLVQQTPNKPVWKLADDEQIRWHAVAVQTGDNPDDVALLAFSSLPKAVGFMQPAVMQGFVQDVNKVGKFSREVASGWAYAVLVNPTLESVQNLSVTLIEMNPDTAEAPDE